MARMIHINEKPGWVRIECSGGCGRFVELRLKKVIAHDYYICKSKESGHECESRLPTRLPGQVAVHEFNAAASFSGVTYRFANDEEAASVARARAILADGLTQMAIDKARRG